MIIQNDQCSVYFDKMSLIVTVIWLSIMVIFFLTVLIVVTPHAQRERGKVIGRGVHIHTYPNKKIESYFRDRLTFSNVDSRTSR